MSDARSKLVIVGIGDDGLAGLTEPARKVVMSADLILGAPSTLALARRGAGAEAAARAGDECWRSSRWARRSKARRPVLVSSGDPLFYGVARYLCDRLGKDLFEVVPHVSSMQLAFARVKESWEDATLINLAGRPIESVIDRIRTAEKIGLFSSDRVPAAQAGARATGSRHRLLPGVRLREPRLARRAGDAGRARRSDGMEFNRAERVDPDSQAEPAGPGEPGRRGGGSSATRTRRSPRRCPSAG